MVRRSFWWSLDYYKPCRIILPPFRQGCKACNILIKRGKYRFYCWVWVRFWEAGHKSVESRWKLSYVAKLLNLCCIMSLPERGDYVTSTFLVKPIVNLAICIPFNDINMFRTLSQKCIKYRKRTWLWKLNKFLFAIISVIYLCWRLYMWGVCVTNRGGFFGWWISSDIYTGVHPCLLLRNMRAVLYLTGGCNWFQVRHLRAPSAQVSDIDPPLWAARITGTSLN